MELRWIHKEADPQKVDQLEEALDIHPVLCQLLVQRGIATYEEARQFFRPSPQHLHSPFLMKNMDSAVHRIEEALHNKEKILVYGDYDVDGTTAVSLVYTHLSGLTDRLDYYIPDRYEEGYGVSDKAVEWATENDVDLIIALDCGIKAIDKVEKARGKGIDFIICDHHRPGDKLPEAIAVLDPKQEGCQYPYQELSGCGIGFKLIQAFTEQKGGKFSELVSYLDLVAVSIGADIVPMTGENRTLARLGLQKISGNPRPGLRALMDVADLQLDSVDEQTGEVIKQDVTISDIVFKIAPRINAAGRMEDAKQAVQTLVANNYQEAREHAQKLNQTNTYRQEQDQQMTKEAAQLIDKDQALQNRKSTVLYNPNWHKGVIGIVASRLIEHHYYRPTVLLTRSNGVVSGSARSVKGFDLYQALAECEEWITQFGGHKYAAGLTMEESNVEAFAQQFEKVVSEQITEQQLTPALKIDAELDLGDITPSFFKILKQFAPFGPGNMRPVFKTAGVKDAGYSRIVGNNHLKLSVRQNGSPTKYGIAFEKGDLHPEVMNSDNFTLCYTLKENHWKGNTSIELYAKDFHFES